MWRQHLWNITPPCHPQHPSNDLIASQQRNRLSDATFERLLMLKINCHHPHWLNWHLLELLNSRLELPTSYNHLRFIKSLAVFREYVCVISLIFDLRSLVKWSWFKIIFSPVIFDLDLRSLSTYWSWSLTQIIFIVIFLNTSESQLNRHNGAVMCLLR